MRMMHRIPFQSHFNTKEMLKSIEYNQKNALMAMMQFYKQHAKNESTLWILWKSRTQGRDIDIFFLFFFLFDFRGDMSRTV